MELHYTVVDTLPAVARHLRRVFDSADGSVAAHARHMAQTVALQVVEYRPINSESTPGESTPGESTPGVPARIISWNIERGYHLPEIVQKLKTLRADVVLLSEVDQGMARTDQQHVAREISQRLKMQYLYGVEFVELDLGSERERQKFEGQENHSGFHGAAILSKIALQRPALLRLESAGKWYQSHSGERRIGGRMALLSEVEINGQRVTIANTHFESHSTPDERARQMEVLLDGIELYNPNCPVLIGGDFNTNTCARNRADWDSYIVMLDNDTPGRFANPIAFEPMFTIAAARGYDWQQCNMEGTTTRLHPWHLADKPLAKLDWFFTRALKADDPLIHSSSDEKTGLPLSDHDLLSVSVKPA